MTQHQQQIGAAVVSTAGMFLIVIGAFASLVDVGTLCPLGVCAAGAILVFAGLCVNDSVSRDMRRNGHR